MIERLKWAFIIDKDEFVRLSLNKILNKYGFQVEEIDDFSQLEKRIKDVRGGSFWPIWKSRRWRDGFLS